MSASIPVVEARNLVKHYPKVHAVNGVSFSCKEGQCFGLLGPNGAGKTTTIEMMEGITRPTSGEILYRGQPIGPEYKKRIGIQFQETALQDYLTVREVLKLFQSFYDTPADIEELAKLCRLEEFWDRDHDQLSGGQRQRVLLAIGLVNNPDLVFLDEPTTGLDPQARRNFWDLVKTIKAQGRTVILTTHYMEEAYVLCDEIAIMDRGRIIAQGAPDHLLKQHFDRISVEVPADSFKLDPETLPWPAQLREGTIEIQTESVNDTLRFLISEGVDLSHLKVRSQTLEDLFLALTGEELRV